MNAVFEHFFDKREKGICSMKLSYPGYFLISYF